MHRFFVTPESVSGNMVLIDKEQSHHILKVLRLKSGDQVELFDGQGHVFSGILSRQENGGVLAEIQNKVYHTNEPAVRVVLAQGIARGEKMDYLIQKAVEIGVSAIVPFVSERTVVVLDQNKSQRKNDRWKKIAREACKQSKRNIIPEISPVILWPQLLTSLQDKRAVILYEEEENIRLREILAGYKDDLKTRSITIIVGPEGGFTPDEIQMAKDRNISVAGLGSRILRTETAGLAAASIILYEGGDLG